MKEWGLPSEQIEKGAPTFVSLAEKAEDFLDDHGMHKLASEVEDLKDDTRPALEEIELFTQGLERTANGKIRRSLLGSLSKRKMFVAITALAALAQTKTGRLAMDLTTLKDVAAWEGHPKNEELPSYEVMRSELEEAIGEDTLEAVIPVHAIDYIESIRKARSEREKQMEPLTVSGFEESFGVSDKSIGNIIHKSLPAGWTGTNAVKELTVVTGLESRKDRDLVRSDSEKNNEQWYAVGLKESGRWIMPARISIVRDLGESIPLMNRTIVHEIAHANDWEDSSTMSPQDRLTLLYLVHERVSSPYRIRFPYVESIQNEDKKEEHLERCEEYFAELMKEALTIHAYDREEWERRFLSIAVASWADPGAYPSEYATGAENLAEDLKIVDWYLNKVDPSFKPWDGYLKREQLTKAAVHEAFSSEIELRLSRIPSAPLRVLLQQVGDGRQLSYDLQQMRIREQRRFGSVTGFVAVCQDVVKIGELLRRIVEIKERSFFGAYQEAMWFQLDEKITDMISMLRGLSPEEIVKAEKAFTVNEEHDYDHKEKANTPRRTYESGIPDAFWKEAGKLHSSTGTQMTGNQIRVKGESYTL